MMASELNELAERQSWNLGQYIGCPEQTLRAVLDENNDLRQRVEALEQANTEKLYALLLSYRGIDKPCEGCGGMGTKSYGSTATWRHGIGGQSVTTDVCDKCWGSGDHDKPWRSWKQIDTLTAKLEACEQERDKWKEKHEYLDYFFNSAITERNELRVAKRSLIDTKKALQRQLQQREEEIADLVGKVQQDGTLLDEIYLALDGLPFVEKLPDAPYSRVIPAPHAIKSLRARLDVLTTQYNDLIMQVGKKFPNESRHETAKRYLQKHENECGKGGPCMDATREKGEG